MEFDCSYVKEPQLDKLESGIILYMHACAKMEPNKSV